MSEKSTNSNESVMSIEDEEMLDSLKSERIPYDRTTLLCSEKFQEMLHQYETGSSSRVVGCPDDVKKFMKMCRMYDIGPKAYRKKMAS